MLWGELIRKSRKRADLTLDGLSEGVGIDATALSRIETGHQIGRWHTVVKLRRYFCLDGNVAMDAIERTAKRLAASGSTRGSASV